jgi:tellurite resistance protein
VVNERIHLNTFGIPFALCGIASVWSQAELIIPGSSGVSIGLWAIALIVFIALLVAHSSAGNRTRQKLISQLRHPEQAPMASLVPMIVMLLGHSLSHYLQGVGESIYFFGLAVATLFALWLAGFWIRGGFNRSQIHGGYLLPFASSAMVAALLAAKFNHVLLSLGVAGFGFVSWVWFGSLLIKKIFFHEGLSDALVPTKSILVAPPALAATTYLVIFKNAESLFFIALIILLALCFALQIVFLRRYISVSFATSHWSFTFPTVAVCVLAQTWLEIAKPAYWQILSILPVALATLLVVTNAIRDVARRI